MVHGGSLFEDGILLDGEKWGVLSHVETIYGMEARRVHEKSLPHTHYNTQIIPFVPEVKMWRRDGDLTLLKRVRLSESIGVDYRISSREGKHNIIFSVTNEVAPSPMELLRGGRISVNENSLAHGGITCSFDLEEMEIAHERAVFAERVTGELNRDIAPDKPLEFSISLSIDQY